MGDPNKKILRSKSQLALKPKPLNRIQSLQLMTNNHRNRRRNESINGLEELIQCGICLEKLSDSRMLPCQHTFCLNCLQSQFMAKNLMAKLNNPPPSVDEIKEATSPKTCTILCPICQSKITLEKGFDSLEQLPKNLYIDSLLKVVQDNNLPIPSKQTDYRCVKCQTFSEAEEQICQHCVQIFCKVCFREHLSELEANLSILIKQVEETKSRLDHKLENFENRSDQLIESIRETTIEKIEEIKKRENTALNDVKAMKHEAKILYENINKSIDGLRQKLSSKFGGDTDGKKVSTFMKLHRETSSLLTQVNHYGEARIIFDKETFRLDQDTEGIYNDIDEADLTSAFRIANPSENVETMTQYYKTRPFIPKLVWNRCPRPAHIAVSPWQKDLLYIAATDTHTVLILNKTKNKLERRLSSPEMLYPQGIAFSEKNKEIYISDKWKHCIHVFSDSGDYLRAILSKGNGMGKVRSPDGLAIGPNGELVISDSGNDRIIVVDPQNGEHLSTIGLVNNKTLLNLPAGVAVSGDKVVIADTGNHRIKIFDINTRNQVNEFGMLGRGRGQFRSAEVVAVDSLGFILVGDGGNARIQVFKPDGTLVKVFGKSNSDGFGWVSGICVTDEHDIVATDGKNRCLKIF